MPLLIRDLHENDSFEELTVLLHRAYAALAERGMNYVATNQSVETTRERSMKGRCFVAELDGKLIGTISLNPPDSRSECSYYHRSQVYHFGQFGVLPEYQGQGVARLLHARVLEAAIEEGAEELALDTAEPAAHLIEIYTNWGYEVVDRIQWPKANYRSVVMSRSLRSCGQ